MSKLNYIAAGLAIIAANFAVAAPATAQNPGWRLMVLAEDQDPNSVKRSSDIFHRVISEIQEQFARDEVIVLDEGFLAGKTAWEIRDRRPRHEMVQVLDLICAQGVASQCPRAMTLLKIRAIGEDYGGVTKVTVRVSGDVFDRQTAQFLGSWEAPKMAFPAASGCKGVCIEEVVGDHARDIALSVGKVLRDKTARYNEAAKVSSSQTLSKAGTSAPVKGAGEKVAGAANEQGLLNQYTINFRNFTRSEIVEMTEIMSQEFPNFYRIESVTGPAENRLLSYASYAPAYKLDQWLHLMMLNLNYAESAIQITLSNETEFVVDRVIGNSASREGYRTYN